VKITKHFSIIRLGLLALIAGILTGCGGGGGGGGGGVAAGGGGAPTGNVAGSGQPAANFTAANPNQAFGVVLAAGGTPVSAPGTVQVQFTVINSAGNVVTGLTTNNVKFLMGKLVRSTAQPGTAGWAPDQWVNYITQTEDTTGACTTGAGGTTLAGTSSCNHSKNVGSKGGAAVLAQASQPNTDTGGTLTFNSTTNTYTYTFGIDPTKAVAPADRPNAGAALWAPTAINRVAITLNFTDSNGQAVSVDPYIDVTNITTTGSTQVAYNDPTTRVVVSRQSCNTCHAQLSAHGSTGRVDPQTCVLCHNSGNTDPHSGNVLDFRTMIHKIHAGKQLLTDYSIWGYSSDGYYDTHNNFNRVGFPQDTRNCTKCHDGSANAIFPTTQGNNWNLAPSAEACGTCHDGINFPAGTGTTLNGVQTNHVGGPQANDQACAFCHTPAAISVYHETTIPSANNPTVLTGVPTFQYVMVPSTVASPNPRIVSNAGSYQVVVDFEILQGITIGKDGTISGGTPVTLNTYNAANPAAQVMVPGTIGCTLGSATSSSLLTGPTFKVAYSTGQDGITHPSDWNMPHDALSLCDVWANTGTAGYPNTLTSKGNGVYEVLLAQTSGKWSYSTGTQTYTFTAGHPMTLPPDAQLVTAVMSDNFYMTQAAAENAGQNIANGTLYSGSPAVATPYSYVPIPGIPDMETAVGFDPDGVTQNVGRRVVFNAKNCDSCHDRLGADRGVSDDSTSPYFHTGNYSIAMCAVCHTPNQGGSGGWGASIKSWVHAIHGASKRTIAFTDHGTSTLLAAFTGPTPPTTVYGGTVYDGFFNIGYPQPINNCAACHNTNSAAGTTTYDFSDPQYTPSVVNNLLDVIAASGTINAVGFSNPNVPTATQAVNTGVLAYGLKTGVSYGSGTTFNTTTTDGMVNATDQTNLVSSPITASCASCHDSTEETNHMKDMGGLFYQPRSIFITNGTQETCLVCHGAGQAYPIAVVHQQ
jgi:OmcA/MtrC family decaheme c-type cytochrome